MNRWKFRRNTSRLILLLASLLTLIVILITGMSSYAITPDGAYLGKIEGTGLAIGASNSRERKPATLQQKLRQNTILYVPGGNKPWAHLGFFQDSPLDSSGLLVKAGPSQIISEWSFPCSARGRFTIAWKKGSDRGCEAGVRVQSSSKKSGLPNNNLQASRRLLAQAEDEVTVVPTPGQNTIQTADTFTGISVNVLVGNVRVKSAKNPGGRLVKAGERYNYPQDTITPIDINPIVNSPEMQEFLNPNNWSSPDIPQRIADGFSEQLGEMRTALGKGAPAVASNSGLSVEFNTDRLGSDYNSFDLPEERPELCQAACANDSRCQAYTYVKPGYYDSVRYKARCFLKEPAPPATPAECCVSGIKSNPSSAQNNYCNSRTVTQPISSSNSHDGTSYQIWMDFSRGQEVSSAVCGRQYWVKEDPNHPNYQIRFVYLVDGQGKCVVPYLYKETDGGTLEVVRPAPECSSGS